MKVLYLDIFAGISGDMMIGALIDAGLSPDLLIEELSKIPLKNYSVGFEKVLKRGLSGTKFSVQSTGTQPHRHLSHINDIIMSSELKPSVKEKAMEMFLKLAEAEGKIHNQSSEKVHFHEVGAVDSIIDILATLIGLDILGIEKVISSPVPLSRGWVNCEHGIIPVPAPATLELLKNIPLSTTTLEGETVTPTGALITTSLAQGYGPIPSMTIERTGYGAGSKELPIPNLLRIMVGEEYNSATVNENEIYILETNIDDLNPEFFPYITEKLLQKGALDVFLNQVIMKKGRPGVILTVLSPLHLKESLESIIFSESSTLGVRSRIETRSILERSFLNVDTPHGSVKVKIGRDPVTKQILNCAPELEECRKIAENKGLPLKTFYKQVVELINNHVK